MSDVIVVMRDGRIQQQGAPEALYQRPVNRFVAGFIGSSNFLEARLVSHDPLSGRAVVETSSGLRIGGIVTDSAARPAAGQAVDIAIRPERLRIQPASADAGPSDGEGWTSVAGQVLQGTYLGDQTEYRVATAAGQLVIRRPTSPEGAGRAFGPGEPVAVRWHEDANLVLTA